MLIDTHAHLNFSAFKLDVKEVIRRSLDNNIWIINVGTKYETSQRALEIAEGYSEGIYATVGLHPLHLETGLVKIKNDTEEIEVKTREEEFDYEKYKELAQSNKVVAIGEIGLDYYWKPKTTQKKELFKAKQKNLFIKQLELAKELSLPVIIHCRMANQDLIKILKESENLKPKKAVAHGFVGTTEELEEYLALGYHIGFNGIIFKQIEGVNFEANIKKTPLDRILIETDCPYLTPPQVKGRNEPIYLKYIVQKIAEIKGLSSEELAEIAAQNARQLFGV